ncbi:MAG: hypothetical protein HY225_00730 [Candidatus Vogelbacteria bacterium]|nr:hypothetical protein [Candidatus Vogelbacteria bacterium]
MKLILEFNNISKSDASIAGGKGASLGEMTRAGIPVPPGFVVLAGTFEKFLEETDLDVEVDAILDSVNHNEIHTVENASEKIQALILGADMPEDIEAEIENYFKKLDTKYVAVRSSATAEDSASAAWAGQLDSYLNTTEGTLLKNVKRCWASLFTPRAIFYRFEKELHKTKISVAVVVQKMVVSDVSGIAFSVHPVTEDRNQLIIEAGFGLGEAIVSGSITPDSYVVEKEPRRIIDKNVAEQARGIYRAEGGGDEWRDILSEKRSEQKLSDDQIFELSEIILRIESHYGFPCDIEWALEASTFYITQSRPITTLSISEEKKIVQKLTKFATRPVFPAIIFELQYRAATAGLKEWIGTGFSDCIIKCDGRKIDGYYLEAELSELKKPVLEFIASQKFQALMDLVAKFLDAYNDSIKSKQLDRSFQLLTKDLSYVVATIVCSIADKFWHDDLDQKMFDSVAQFRTQWDRVLRPPAETIEEYLKSKSLPFFSSLELINTPDWMNGGFVFSRGKFLRVPFEDFLCDNNLLIEEVVEIGETNEIKGAVAYAGTCRGIVRIIYGPQEFVQIKKGDILVTSMTKPSFAPIFPLLKAIITDEGGTLSHAAIISRELKIPCIISTKIATQVLKDGDMVEVDTEKGVVRKINAGINKEAGEEFKEAKRILKQYSVKPPLIRKGFHAKFYPIDFVQLLWKKWGDYSGFYYRLHISVWSNDYWYIYYIPEEFTALRDHYFAKIANDKKFLKKHHSDWSKSCNQLRKSITKLDKSLKNNEKFK